MNSQHTQDEIAKFDELADDFWNLEGMFKTLHQINPIRVAFCEESIDLQGKRVADIGCGGGILAEALAEKGSEVIGVDLSSVGIASAKTQQQKSGSNVDYRVQSVADCAEELKNNKLDAVFCMEMLEHVESPQEIITDCAKMVKDGGPVIFSTINRTHKAHILAVIVAEYVVNMVPRGTHDHSLFIKPSELQRMAHTAGLEPVDIMGFEYRPFHKDFIRTDNTDINYIFAFRKTNSTISD